MRQLSTEELDAIRFESLEPPDQLRGLSRVVGADDEALAVLLSFQDWPHLRYYADCVKDAMGGSYDEVGFLYDSDERWPGDEPFTGVCVHVPWAKSVVGRDAFERLMARFYRAMIDVATRARDPVTRSSWWPQFTGDVAVLTERVNARPKSPESDRA